MEKSFTFINTIANYELHNLEFMNAVFTWFNQRFSKNKIYMRFINRENGPSIIHLYYEGDTILFSYDAKIR